MYIGVKVLVTYDVAYTFESKESEDIFLNNVVLIKNPIKHTVQTIHVEWFIFVIIFDFLSLSE